MNLRQIAMGAYYYGSLPMRVLAEKRMRQSGQAPLCVLFYHRVGEGCPNQWSIAPQVFRAQMHWLLRHVDLISLQELQDRVRSGHNDRVRVAVTFDDGYAENYEHAIPFLVQHKIPATYFVSLQYVTEQKPFPHDVQAGHPLAPNTVAQLKDIADRGIEIGAHTRTHGDIAKITRPEQLIDEVVTATRELGELVQQPIRYFAFPYGQPDNLNAATVELARRAGLRGVCSAFGAYNHPGDDAFHIRRFHADPGFVRLKNWVTIDPRKMRRDTEFKFPDTGVRVEALDATTKAPIAPISGLPAAGGTVPHQT